MKAIKPILTIIACCFVLNGTAQKTIDTIATKVGSYDIPIKIQLPKKSIEKSPIFFFVHGGGWNGGTQNEVPPATISGDANFLVNELGIIYVGLAYRCKGNNATFADAINDLESSVKWFLDNANRFNADTSRIGFGGASAGSTLSAVMAQKYPNCKVYIGSEGMYNLVDHDEKESPFPSTEARKIYGLDTTEKSKMASAFYNLKENPPASLLLHGKEDRLCHFTQSIKFAEKIKKSGGKAKFMLYDEINHTCLSAAYPDVFKKSVLEIATLFISEFKIKNSGLNIEDLELELIDFGLEEIGEDSEGNIVIRTAFNEFGNMSKALEEKGIEVVTAELTRIPVNTVELNEEQAQDVLKMVDKLEQDDDVQKVYHNLK